MVETIVNLTHNRAELLTYIGGVAGLPQGVEMRLYPWKSMANTVQVRAYAKQVLT